MPGAALKNQNKAALALHVFFRCLPGFQSSPHLFYSDPQSVGQTWDLGGASQACRSGFPAAKKRESNLAGSGGNLLYVAGSLASVPWGMGDLVELFHQL